MKDKYVTRDEFNRTQEENDMRFNYLNLKTKEIAQEVDEIYPDIREWIDQQSNIDVEKQRKFIDELVEEKLREMKLL
jgi:heme oxygenase